MNLNQCFVILEKFLETSHVVDSKIRIRLFSLFANSGLFKKGQTIHSLYGMSVKIVDNIIVARWSKANWKYQIMGKKSLLAKEIAIDDNLLRIKRVLKF